METAWINALLGGALIGLSVSLMLLWNGRVTGISGILYGLFSPTRGETPWRLSFVGGLLFGGLALRSLRPEAFPEIEWPADWKVVLAGVLVGFGTVLGSGCTSGHGVCGISRLSLRSVVATLLFVGTGILSVSLFRTIGVLP